MYETKPKTAILKPKDQLDINNAWKASKYEFFLVCIFLYSVQTGGNKDQKKNAYLYNFYQVNKLDLGRNLVAENNSWVS